MPLLLIQHLWVLPLIFYSPPHPNFLFYSEILVPHINTFMNLLHAKIHTKWSQNYSVNITNGNTQVKLSKDLFVILPLFRIYLMESHWSQHIINKTQNCYLFLWFLPMWFSFSVVVQCEILLLHLFLFIFNCSYFFQ